ncbi:MAG: type II toxin-antitoxin system VapC family toxin [Candidatus Micrarchaeota archaeon]
MPIADSSFLIAFFRESDPLHSRALADMEACQGQKLVIPIPILYETLTVLRYKENIDASRLAHERLSRLEAVEFYRLSPDEESKVLESFFSSRQELSVADAVVLHLTRVRDTPMLSYDQDLLKSRG